MSVKIKILQSITERVYDSKMDYADIIKLNKENYINIKNKIRFDKEFTTNDDFISLGLSKWGDYYLIPLWFAPYIHPKTKGVKAGSGVYNLHQFKEIDLTDHIMCFLNFGLKEK